MTPPAATATRREPRARSILVRRRRAARRRRSLLAVVCAALVIVAAVIAIPLAQKAVNDLGLPLSYQNVIRRQAAAKRLDPALIAAVIYAETKFDPSTSSAGAEGLMQILPQTAAYLAHRSGATTFTIADLATPQVNIAYGSYYLRYLFDEYHGNELMALAAYNGGSGNVDGWVAAARAHHDPFTIGDIPFPETRAYVERVRQAREDYRRTYATQLGYR